MPHIESQPDCTSPRSVSWLRWAAHIALLLIAGFVISLATDTAIYNYGWPSVLNRTRSLAASLQQMDDSARRNAKPVATVEYANNYLAGGSDPDDLLWLLSQSVDPWGHSYKCRRNVVMPDGTVTDSGIYSLGEDGVSASNGDDPDDLNSWDDQCYSFYSRRDTIRYFLGRFIIGIPWAIGLGITFRILSSAARSHRLNKGVTAG